MKIPTSTLTDTVFNAELFNINGKPLEFSLDSFGPVEFHNIVKIIEAFGGRLCSSNSPVFFLFVKPDKIANPSCYHYDIKFLEDSITAQKLQNLENYRLTSPMLTKTKMLVGECETSQCCSKQNNNARGGSRDGLLDFYSQTKATRIKKASEVNSTSKVENPKNFGSTIKIRHTTNDTRCFPRNKGLHRSFNFQKNKNWHVNEFGKFTHGKLRKNHTSNDITKSKNHSMKFYPPHNEKSGSQSNIHEKNYVFRDELINDSIINPHAQMINNISLLSVQSTVNQSVGSLKQPLSRNIDSGNDSMNVERTSTAAGHPQEQRTFHSINTNTDVKLCHAESNANQTKQANVMEKKKFTNDDTSSSFLSSDNDSDTDYMSQKSKQQRSKSPRKRQTIHRWTENENRSLVQYLIDKKAILRSKSQPVWKDVLAEGIIAEPKPSFSAIHKHFKKYVAWNYKKYTNDPVALQEFEKIYPLKSRPPSPKNYHYYTEEDNCRMIQFLIEKKAILCGKRRAIWKEFLKHKTFHDPEPSADALATHFRNSLAKNYRKYTNNGSAIKVFELLNASQPIIPSASSIDTELKKSPGKRKRSTAAQYETRKVSSKLIKVSNNKIRMSDTNDNNEESNAILTI